MTENFTNLQTQVAQMASEVIDADNLFLVDVVVRGQKGSRVIEIYVDGDDGVGVDELARISRRLAAGLEEADLIKGRYHLNVSSPGQERDLLVPRQFARHQGKEVELKVKLEEGVQELEGVMEKFDGNVLHLVTKNGTISVAFEDVVSAQIKLPW